MPLDIPSLPSVVVHDIRAVGEFAYDVTQTDESIQDGHVIIAHFWDGSRLGHQVVVGVMCKAWPVAVGEVTGDFHRLDGTWEAHEGGKYAFAAGIAEAIANGIPQPE